MSTRASREKTGETAPTSPSKKKMIFADNYVIKLGPLEPELAPEFEPGSRTDGISRLHCFPIELTGVSVGARAVVIVDADVAGGIQ